MRPLEDFLYASGYFVQLVAYDMGHNLAPRSSPGRVRERSSPLLHRLALQKEHPCQPTLAECLAEDAESKIRNQDQQHDEVAGQRFLQTAADKIAQRCRDRLTMKKADDSFLDNGQDYQQHQEGERLIQRRPDQRP